MTEEEKQKRLVEDRITVHKGEFIVEQLTDETHSLTASEYRQKALIRLEKLKEELKKKQESPETIQKQSK